MTEWLCSSSQKSAAVQKKRDAKPISIRLAAREDMDTLFALDRVCFRPGIAYSKVELQYFLFHLRSISIVAENESGIAGFAIVEFSLEGGRRVGHVVTIDVSPGQRRQGVGGLLMESLLDFCCKTGARLLRLEVAEDNQGAIAFYRRLGFEETGRIPGFYLGRLDALRMELILSAGAAQATLN
jgi:[ribosomal protein S18]-alanine N-acetyltransferase